MTNMTTNHAITYTNSICWPVCRVALRAYTAYGTTATTAKRKLRFNEPNNLFALESLRLVHFLTALFAIRALDYLAGMGEIIVRCEYELSGVQNK